MAPDISATTVAPDGPWYTLLYDGSVRPTNPGDTTGWGYIIYPPVGPARFAQDRIAAAPPPLASLEHRDPYVASNGRGGPGTNNEAEYRGLVAGLSHALRIGVRRLQVVGDSKLTLYQTAGYWRCKSSNLQGLCSDARDLSKLFTRISYRHIKRGRNDICDALAKEGSLPLGPLTSLGPTGFETRPTKLFTDYQAALLQYAARVKGAGSSMMARAFHCSQPWIYRIMTGEAYSYITEEQFR